jgi:hypothetical protein
MRLVYCFKPLVNPSSRSREIGTESQRFTTIALASRHSDGPPTEHRMTVTTAPGASSGCTKAYPIASDAPTTSPSHGDTSSVHGESPRVIPEKRPVLSHPRLHHPLTLLPVSKGIDGGSDRGGSRRHLQDGA